MRHEKRLYLRLGDKVVHRDYGQWGEGVVVEEMTSCLDGGTCLVRIDFRAGRQRTFSNDLDNSTCCYYFGLKKLLELDWEAGTLPRRSRRMIR